MQFWASVMSWLEGLRNSVIGQLTPAGSIGHLKIIIGFSMMVMFIALLVGTILVVERLRRPRTAGTTPADETTVQRGPGFFARTFKVIVFFGLVGINYMVLSADLPMLNDMMRKVIESYNLPVAETTLVVKMAVMLVVSIIAYRWITSLVRGQQAPPSAEVVADRTRGVANTAITIVFGLVVLGAVWMFTQGGTRGIIQVTQAATPSPAQAIPSPIRLTAADCNGQGKTYYLAKGQEIINGALCPSGFDTTGGGPVNEYLLNGSVRVVGVSQRLGFSGSLMTKLVATAEGTSVYLTLYPPVQSPNTAQAQRPRCPSGYSCPRWP